MRVAERDAQAARYEALSIPQRREALVDQPKPQVGVVQMDGGRFQFLDRQEPQRNEDDTFWRETKVGCLWSMTSEASVQDPCPKLPKSFVGPERIGKIVRDIRNLCSKINGAPRNIGDRVMILAGPLRGTKAYVYEITFG